MPSMTRKFNYKYGEIELGQKSIIIQDEKFRKSQKVTLWILTATIHFLGNGFTGSPMDYVQLLIVVMYVGILIYSRKFIWKDIIELDKVKSIRLRERWFSTLLDIEMMDGKIRRVAGLSAIVSGIQKYLKENNLHE